MVVRYDNCRVRVIQLQWEFLRQENLRWWWGCSGRTRLLLDYIWRCGDRCVQNVGDECIVKGGGVCCVDVWCSGFCV